MKKVAFLAGFAVYVALVTFGFRALTGEWPIAAARGVEIDQREHA